MTLGAGRVNTSAQVKKTKKTALSFLRRFDYNLPILRSVIDTFCGIGVVSRCHPQKLARSHAGYQLLRV
jgi:hypothetical protein